MSHRQKKKFIQGEVSKLKKLPGWNPHERIRTDPLEQLRSLDQESQNARTYEQSTECKECKEIQEQTDDSSALCEVHLQQVLGF